MCEGETLKTSVSWEDSLAKYDQRLGLGGGGGAGCVGRAE